MDPIPPATKHSNPNTVMLLAAIITLGNLGTILHKSSRVYLFQQAQCLDYYRIHDPTKISLNYHVEESLCKLPAIQSRLSIVDGIDSFLQCLPRKPFCPVGKPLLSPPPPPLSFSTR